MSSAQAAAAAAAATAAAQAAAARTKQTQDQANNLKQTGITPVDGVLPDLALKEDDRFAKALKDMKDTAMFGLNVDDVITAKSKGVHDDWRQLRMQVRIEFFTFKQVMVIMFWGFIAGMFVGTISMAFSTPNAKWNVGNDVLMNLGLFFLCMGISTVINGTQTYSGPKTCTDKKKWSIAPLQVKYQENYIVDDEHRGMQCFTDRDCTAAKMPLPHQYGMCQHAVPRRRRISNKLGLIVAITGLVMTIFTYATRDYRPPKRDTLQSVVYGIFFGLAQAIIFS